MRTKHNNESEKPPIFLWAVIGVLLVLTSFPEAAHSFSLGYQDKYGSTSFQYQNGTLNDKVVFENTGLFDLNISGVGANEPMICVEWNDEENEGGNDGVFEGDRCWVSEDIFGNPEEGACLSYMLNTLSITTVERDIDLDVVLNFNMEDSTAYKVTTWFKSFECADTDPDNVTQEDSDAETWYIIDVRKHDCDGSRSNDFDLEGYFINGDGDRAWLNIYVENCIDMASDFLGLSYSLAPLSLSLGDVRCDVEEANNEEYSANTNIEATDNSNDHPCTIDLNVDVGNCNNIFEGECQTDICNDDNRCGSCEFVAFSITSDPADADTDDNFLLNNGTTFGQKPTYTQYNSDGGPDCVVYDYDNDGIWDVCNGAATIECAAYGPTCTGTFSDTENLISLLSSTEFVTAEIVDDSCNAIAEESLGSRPFYTIQFRNVKLKSSITDVTDYTLSSDSVTINEDTSSIEITWETEGDYYLGYECTFITPGEALTTDDDTGIYDAGTEYSCSMDISAHGQDYNDSTTIRIKPYIDNDVYDIIDFNSEQVYDGFISDSDYYDISKKVIIGNWLDFNINYPVTCEYNTPCYVNDNFSITDIPTAYNYAESKQYVYPQNKVRIRYYNQNTLDLMKIYEGTMSGADTKFPETFWLWSVNNSFIYPVIESGIYFARIELCYDFWFNSVWYCDDLIIPVVVPVNQLTTVITAYQGTEQLNDDFSVNKFATVKFCTNTSYVGANNNNVRYLLDYDGDGVWDYNNTYLTTKCQSVVMGINDSGSNIKAIALLSSEERSGGTSEIIYTVNGLCNDGVDDWDEGGSDNPNATVGWSEKCWGSCYDNIKNANEKEPDYDGRCGKCSENPEILKNDDFEWLLLHDALVLTFPFAIEQCVEFQGAATVIPFIIIFIIVVFIVLFIFLLFLIILPVIFALFGFKFNPLRTILKFIGWLFFLDFLKDKPKKDEIDVKSIKK